MFGHSAPSEGFEVTPGQRVGRARMTRHTCRWHVPDAWDPQPRFRASVGVGCIRTTLTSMQGVAMSDVIWRSVLPIPGRKYVGVTTFDAKDPQTSFAAIEPPRPPAGAPNVLIVLLDDVASAPPAHSADPSTRRPLNAWRRAVSSDAAWLWRSRNAPLSPTPTRTARRAPGKRVAPGIRTAEATVAPTARPWSWPRARA
jgi:hypothetical protein